jgi:methionine-rich copper-binding protein CopC
MKVLSRTMLVAACALVALTVTLSAHMKMDKSEPTPDAALTVAPKHVQLWFTQKPDLKVTKIELEGPSGPVKLAAAHMMGAMSVMAAVDGELKDGAYTVSWQSAGDDGHVQKGKYAFQLKRAQ